MKNGNRSDVDTEAESRLIRDSAWRDHVPGDKKSRFRARNEGRIFF